MRLFVALVAMATGAIIQGSIGFGLSLVATPMISLVDPASLPVTILFASLPMTAWMAFRERGAIEVRGFVEITIGRIPGTIAAAAVVTAVPADRMAVLIGAVVLVAVGLSVFAPEFELRTRWRLLAGIFSGFMGTAAAIGGPALALAYQRRPGPQLRSTLALAFVVGSIMSLIALAVAGEVHASDFVFALQLFPALALGLFIAARLHRWLDRKWLRPAVLLFAAISGLAAIVKGLIG